jgi:hypothetical protein
MRLFEEREIREAVAYAADGGQALHLFGGAGAYPNAPAPFKKHKDAAHLFDQDKARLILTSKRLGVNVIRVSREGEAYQHVDLCGRPLDRAKAQCENHEPEWSTGSKRRIG